MSHSSTSLEQTQGHQSNLALNSRQYRLANLPPHRRALSDTRKERYANGAQRRTLIHSKTESGYAKDIQRINGPAQTPESPVFPPRSSSKMPSPTASRSRSSSMSSHQSARRRFDRVSLVGDQRQHDSAASENMTGSSQQNNPPATPGNTSSRKLSRSAERTTMTPTTTSRRARSEDKGSPQIARRTSLLLSSPSHVAFLSLIPSFELPVVTDLSLQYSSQADADIPAEEDDRRMAHELHRSLARVMPKSALHQHSTDDMTRSEHPEKDLGKSRLAPLSHRCGGATTAVQSPSTFTSPNPSLTSLPVRMDSLPNIRDISNPGTGHAPKQNEQAKLQKAYRPRRRADRATSTGSILSFLGKRKQPESGDQRVEDRGTKIKASQLHGTSSVESSAFVAPQAQVRDPPLDVEEIMFSAPMSLDNASDENYELGSATSLIISSTVQADELFIGKTPRTSEVSGPNVGPVGARQQTLQKKTALQALRAASTQPGRKGTESSRADAETLPRIYISDNNNGPRLTSLQGISSIYDMDKKLRSMRQMPLVGEDNLMLTLHTAEGNFVRNTNVATWPTDQRITLIYTYEEAVKIEMYCDDQYLLGSVARTMPVSALRAGVFEQMECPPSAPHQIVMIAYEYDEILNDGQRICDHMHAYHSVLRLCLCDATVVGKANQLALAKEYRDFALRQVVERLECRKEPDEYTQTEDKWQSLCLPAPLDELSAHGCVVDRNHLCEHDQLFERFVTDTDYEPFLVIADDLDFSYRQAALFLREYATTDIRITLKLHPGVIASESQNIHVVCSNMSIKTLVIDVVCAVTTLFLRLGYIDISTAIEGPIYSLSVRRSRLAYFDSIWKYFSRTERHLKVNVWQTHVADQLWKDNTGISQDAWDQLKAQNSPRTERQLPLLLGMEPALFAWVYEGRCSDPYHDLPPTRTVEILVMVGRDWEGGENNVWNPREHVGQAKVALSQLGGVPAEIEVSSLRKYIWETVGGTQRQQDAWPDFPVSEEGLLMYAFEAVHPISMKLGMTLAMACGLPAWSRVIIVLRDVKCPRVHLRSCPVEMDLVGVWEPEGEYSPTPAGTPSSSTRDMRPKRAGGLKTIVERPSSSQDRSPSPMDRAGRAKETDADARSLGSSSIAESVRRRWGVGGKLRKALKKLALADESPEKVIEQLAKYGL